MNLGILGAGQLARMLALAAYPLNIKCQFLDPAADACAAALGKHIVAAYDDLEALQALSGACDYLTFEFENVPAVALNSLPETAKIRPSPQALLVTQDRLTEKHLFQTLGVKTAPFAAVSSLDELKQAVADVGLPGILKTRRLGYDGKGQAIIKNTASLADAWQAVGAVPATYEGFVPFNREVSLITVRSTYGETRFYPLVENQHHNGILYLSMVRENDPMQSQAEQIAQKLVEKLDYVGVLVIEFFEVGITLLANEFAPRVHNSGHWTIEGAVTSQFENHLRAVTDLPLGDTAAMTYSSMINIVGNLPDCKEILKVAGAHLHLYDKQPRPGRKIGHVTVTADSESQLQARTRQIVQLVAKP